MKKKYQNDIDFQNPRLINAIDELDICSLLDDCGVEYALEGRNIGENFIGVEICPDCSKDNFHFGIHKEQKFGSCLVCKTYYSPLKLVATFKKISLKKAFDFLIEDSEFEMDVEERVKNIFKSNHREKEYNFRGTDTLPENKPITKEIIKHNDLLKSFIKERRIKYWNIKQYDLRIGTGEHKNKMIFPVYANDKLVSYQWRRIDRKQYHVPENLSKYLYLEDDIIEGRPCIIVEGILDLIHLKTFLDIYYPNSFSITTGFTKALSQYQINTLIEKNPSSIICILDSKAWSDYLKYKNIFPFDVDYVKLPTIGKKEMDPNSLSFNLIRKILKEQLCYE